MLVCCRWILYFWVARPGVLQATKSGASLWGAAPLRGGLKSSSCTILVLERNSISRISQFSSPEVDLVLEREGKKPPTSGSRQPTGVRFSDHRRCHALSKADRPDVARRRSGSPAGGSRKPPFSSARRGPQSRRHDRDLTFARSSDEAFFAVQRVGNKVSSTTLGRPDQIAR